MSLTLQAPTKEMKAKHKDPNKDWSPIACLVNDDGDKRFVYTLDDTSGEQRIDLRAGERYVIEPSHKADESRMIAYVAGVSGSGKSHCARQMAIRYRAIWPKRHICLISKLSEDSTLDKHADKLNIRRIDITSLVTKPFDIKEAFGAMIVIDDVENLPKEQAEAVHKLAEDVCNLGRHESVSLVYLSHTLSDYRRTKTLISEAHYIVLFGHGATAHAINYLLGKTCGLDKHDIKKLRRLPSRSFCVKKTYPPCCLSDSACFMLTGDDDDE